VQRRLANLLPAYINFPTNHLIGCGMQIFIKTSKKVENCSRNCMQAKKMQQRTVKIVEKLYERKKS
jgi:hypothetical protein